MRTIVCSTCLRQPDHKQEFIMIKVYQIIFLKFYVVTYILLLTAVTTNDQKTIINNLVIAIEKEYKSINSAEFNFDQSYNHPFLNIKETSKGKVFYLKSSGKMLWIYSEPKDKQKQFYINGNKLIYYSITDKTAFVNDCYDKDTLSAAIAFLLGSGRLAEHFIITKSDNYMPNKLLFWLSLTPKEKNSPMKKLYLGIKGNKVIESVVEDHSDGKNHFRFTQFNKNKKLDPNIFIFKAPKGVSMQKMPNVVCKKKPLS